MPRSPAAPRLFRAILLVDAGAAPPVTVTVTVEEAVWVTVTAAQVPEPAAGVVVVGAAVTGLVDVGVALLDAPVVEAGTSLSGTCS